MRKLLIGFLLSGLVMSLSACSLLAGQIAGQFSMEVEPQEITIAKGQAAIVTVKIKPITGISLSSVEVVLTGHPVGVSASDISVITESSWEIQVSDTASSGTYELEAQGISRGLNVIPITKKVSFTLIIP